jgi:hypothetical protein
MSNLEITAFSPELPPFANFRHYAFQSLLALAAWASKEGQSKYSRASPLKHLTMDSNFADLF